MKSLQSLTAAILAAASLGVAIPSEAQYSGNGSGIMRPGAGYGSGMMGRGPGMMGWPGDYCFTMMGPSAGYGFSMMGPWSGSGLADPGAAVQSCLSALHARLGISNMQESAWSAFASAVASQAHAMLLFQQRILQSHGTAVERSAQYADFMQQRADDAAIVSDAVAALYGTLGTSQRAAFDRYFAWGGQPPAAGPFGR